MRRGNPGAFAVLSCFVQQIFCVKNGFEPFCVVFQIAAGYHESTLTHIVLCDKGEGITFGTEAQEVIKALCFQIFKLVDGVEHTGLDVRVLGKYHNLQITENRLNFLVPVVDIGLNLGQ